MSSRFARLLPVVVAALIGACSGGREPSTTSPSVSGAQPRVPDGFERSAAMLTYSDGTRCEVCAWIADDDQERRRGLMGVTDLGEADAMVFVFDSPKRHSFWMKDTLIDLSILFVDPEGTVGEVQQMPPCESDPCPTYQPADPFTVAVEFASVDAERFDLESATSFVLLNAPCPEA